MDAALQQLIKRFERSKRLWHQNYVRHQDKPDILPQDMEDMRNLKIQVEELAADVFDTVAEDSEVYNNVLASINTIRDDLSSLYSIVHQANAGDGGGRVNNHPPPPTPPLQHPDKEVDRAVTRKLTLLEKYKSDFEQLELVARKITTDFPTPTSRTISTMKYKFEEAMDKRKSADITYTTLCGDISTYENREKVDNNRNNADTLWRCIDAKFSDIQQTHDSYLDKKLPDADQSAKTTNHLKKLSPPTFSGNKVDYVRFKFEFKQHVTYKEEKDKVLCLKEECLLKDDDKKRVANQYTMEKCWEKLDAKHGGPDETVSEIFKTWKALKSPFNDKTFVQFVETIENGVACIESLHKENELTTSAIMEIEAKLDNRMKREISKLVIKKKEHESVKNIVLNYLSEEKKTAQRNLNNFSSKKDDPPVKSNNTTSRGNGWRGRSRGAPRGRGQQRGDQQQGQQQQGQKTQRQDQGSQRRGGQTRGRDGRGRGRGYGRPTQTSKCLLCDENHDTLHCHKLLDKSTDKCSFLTFCIDNNLCTYCLRRGHTNRDCFNTNNELQCPCGSDHNMYVCCATEHCRTRINWKDTSSGNGFTVCNSAGSEHDTPVVNGTKLGHAILPIQIVKTRHCARLNTMMDVASQNTFLREAAAKRLKLKGIPITYALICTDGRKNKMSGHLYNLILEDREGNLHHIQAIGIKHLSSYYAGFTVSKITPQLKKYKICNSVTDLKLSRDSGQVDLLLGSDLASLHPVKVATVGQLVIMKSVWGTGWTVMGHSDRHIKFTDATVGTQTNFCGVENVRPGFLSPADPVTASQAAATKDLKYLDQISTESIGISVKPKCSSCKVRTDNCKECAMITKTTTYLEYLQDLQIEENIEKIPYRPGYISSYPYNSELQFLLPNDNIAMKRAICVENDMKKRPDDLAQINDVIKKSFENNFFTWLSEDVMEQYEGPVCYIPFNVVYKDSETTPARFCFDSGQVDKNGRSLNSCMGKGSNPINHFGSVIINFRGAEQVAAGDISKMFNRIEVREQDIHLRRFFMRPDGLGGVQPWRVAACTVVNFGETAAPAIAVKVKNKCADDYGQDSPEVTDQIKRHCIMDDINISCKYTENLDDRIKKAEEILANGNFSFKQWIRAGQKQGEMMLGHDPVTHNLGLAWKVEQDLLTYRPKLNFTKKKRNRYSGPDTTAATVDQDFPEHMTKRLALKLQHTVFDPACLIQPWLLKMRIAFRDILFFEKENNCAGWDRPLPTEFRDKWISLTREMFELQNLEFPRSIVPRGYDPTILPTLVLMSDGSDQGQCVVAYLVWTMLDSSTHVSLVTSRVKIASLTKITTPRSELCSGQMSARLGQWIKEELDIKIGDTIHIVDSSIILGMIRNVSLKFDAYTAPRVTEIQSTTDIDSWFWTETQENSSDLGTRDKCSVSDLDVGSMWREGPSWLKLPRDQWPLRSDFKKHQVPGLKREFEILQSVSNLTHLVTLSETIDAEKENVSTEISTTTHSTAATNTDSNIVISKLVDHSNYDCWFKLIRVSAKAIKAIKIFKKENVPSQVELMKQARHLWLLDMMDETKNMMKTNKLSNFIVYEKDGIIYATTRSQQENLNPQDLIVLSPSHPITKKILTSYHNINHKGVQTVVARSRIFYWIPQASKIVSSIKNKCFSCRLFNSEAMQQLMSPVPSYRTKPAPVWNHSMLDLFGPITVTDFVNQRTSRKTWAVIITCLNTRATWVYLAESYSTDHLLSVLRKHEARNGSPSEYHADLGRQIVGADRVIAQAIANIDQTQLENTAAKRGVKFVFGTPHFHAGQGAVERLIAEVKKSLKIIIKNKHLSFAEMDCLLSEASNHVNSRPLQLHPRAGDDGYICPNDIMFGRSDKSPPSVPVTETSLTKRAAHKQRIMDEFWDKWSSSYLQTLTKYHRWQTKHRNVTKGDVIMLLDKEHAKNKFCLGMVDSVKVDTDGQVRRCVVKYKIVSSDPAKYPTSFKYVERNVRGLALLIKAEEREDFENHDLDQDRFHAEANEDSNHSEEGETEDVEEESDVENNSKKEETILAPRTRRAPQRLNL